MNVIAPLYAAAHERLKIARKHTAVYKPWSKYPSIPKPPKIDHVNDEIR